MQLKKKEMVLIVITVILVIILCIGFYYDRNSALLDRTNVLAVSQDPNVKLEKMNKAGFLFARQYYEVRFRIVNNDWEGYYKVFSTAYAAGGGFCGIDGYKQYEQQALTKATIKPNPKADATIWIMGSKLGDKTSENVVYIIDQEADGNAYLYIYYSRK